MEYETEKETIEKDSFLYNTCSSFIVRELIRYAESQAVFTFVIYNREVNGKILLIMLLSWNSFVQTVNENNMNNNNAVGSSTFERVVKVIHEEIDDQNHNLAQNSFDSADPMNFSWGAYDLCCPPPQQAASTTAERIVPNNSPISTTTKASVQIHLQEDEWNELRNSLHHGSDTIPRAISNTTVLLKLGLNDTDGNAALSILQLPKSN
jgi:hypothetical protein